jgi:hypothetical protein
MPNPSTPGTRGGTTDPYKGQYTRELTYNTIYADQDWPYQDEEGMSVMALPPGGYLAAILAKKFAGMDDWPFYLKDVNGAHLTGFILYAQLSCGGVMLEYPVPNLNSAACYSLKFSPLPCKVEFTLIHRTQARYRG